MSSRHGINSMVRQPLLVGVSSSSWCLRKAALFYGGTSGAVFLTHKAPPIFAADNNFKFCHFFKNNPYGMIFHENLADDFHEISYLIFFLKIRKDVAKYGIALKYQFNISWYTYMV